MKRTNDSNQWIETMNRNKESSQWIETMNRNIKSNQWVESTDRIKSSNQGTDSKSRNQWIKKMNWIMNRIKETDQGIWSINRINESNQWIESINRNNKQSKQTCHNIYTTTWQHTNDTKHMTHKWPNMGDFLNQLEQVTTNYKRSKQKHNKLQQVIQHTHKLHNNTQRKWAASR